MKTLVIYHSADMDGKFSAAVCRTFLGDKDVSYIGWDYTDPTPTIPEDVDTIYMVDISIDGLMDDPRLVWIDHHKTAIEKYNPDTRGYRIDGVAACRLCWQWFINAGVKLPVKAEFLSRQVEEPYALLLAGTYDVWDLSDPNAVPFQFGLRACGYKNFDDLTVLIDPATPNLSVADVLRTCRAGKASMIWQQDFAADVCKEYAYVRKIGGIKFAILASTHCRNSSWFPEEAIPAGAEALCGWRYDGEKVTFSLYHRSGREDLDLSVIAKAHGGGGHRGACGMSMSFEEAMALVR